MSASVKTAQAIAEILERHVGLERAKPMIKEMLEIPKLSQSVSMSLARILTEITFQLGNKR